MVELDSFSIDQRIKVTGRSNMGINRIEEHGNIWRVKNIWEKGYFPWIKEDSILLESITDRVTSIDMQIIEDKNFELV